MNNNETKVLDEDLYHEEDVQAVIEQEMNGEWTFMSAEEFLDNLKKCQNNTVIIHYLTIL